MEFKKNLDNDTNKDSINNNASDLIKEMMMNIPGGVIRYENNYDKKVTLVSDNMLEILGCSKDEFHKKYNDCINNIFLSEDENKIVLFGFNNEKHDKFESQIITYNNRKKWVSVNLNKLVNENGVEEIYAIFTDIDEYKMNQESIKIENEMFKRILNKNADIMFEYDVKKDIITFNNIRNFDELKENKVKDFIEHILNGNSIHPDDKAKLIGMVSMDKTADLEFRFMR